MMWYVFPLILLTIGLIGLYLNIRAYKKGETISLKKLFAVLMLLFLGGGVFLQKTEVINIPQLKQLLLAFDTEAREAKEAERLQELEDAQKARTEKMKASNKETQEKLDKIEAHNKKIKDDALSRRNK